MPRQAGVSIENNFTGGLKTEFSGLNFPENSCTETFNCVFDRVGRVTRRYGFDFEPGAVFTTIDRTNSAVRDYLWKNVAGDGNTNLLVIQIGSILHFYDASAPTAINPLSSGVLVATVDLTPFKPAGGINPGTDECQFADGNGYLFVVHPHLNSFYISYDASTKLFTSTAITISIRDFKGTDDGLADATRPTSLTNAHLYNLLNQGWRNANPDDVTTWHTAESNYPNNTDVWWSYKNASDVFSPSTTFNNVNLGNTPAAKGHYILNAFNQDRSTVSGVSGFAVVSTGYTRPSTVAFFQGRAFYSGVNYSGQNSKLYFSQIIEKPTQFGNCYQNSDPTNEALFDLLPSDGGVIDIQGAGTIIKLFPIRGALLVFAYNGIWVISGSTGLGFTAIDYSVSKLSTVRSISASSFIDVLGYPVWWNAEGIYTISVNTAQGGLSVDSMTNLQIAGFYEDIPLDSKRYARGYFNPVEYSIQWVYRGDAANSLGEKYEFDNVLVLNTLTKAFYPWTVSGLPKIHGVTVVDGIGGSVAAVNITDTAGNQVIDTASEHVVVFGVTGATIAPQFKYIFSVLRTNGDYTWSIADNTDVTYRDWASATDLVGIGITTDVGVLITTTSGAQIVTDLSSIIADTEANVDYTSYFITGYRLHADSQRKFQTNYLYVFSDNNGATSYTIQGIWNYANAVGSGKQSNVQTIVNPWANTPVYNDYSVLFRKHKIRGDGVACQFKFSSVTGQPFSIIGWSGWETANSKP